MNGPPKRAKSLPPNRGLPSPVKPRPERRLPITAILPLRPFRRRRANRKPKRSDDRIRYPDPRDAAPVSYTHLVNIGHEKDAFIHYLDLGSQFSSLKKLVAAQQPGKRGVRLEGIKLEPALEKSGKIGAHLEVGQTVMVQVAKEAISTKGPRLTADISLAGRNVVLVPFSSKVFISQKIRSADEKKRLKRIAQGVLPKNFGCLLYTSRCV